MYCCKSKIMARIRWKSTKSRVIEQNSAKRYLIDHSAKDIHLAWNQSCSVGGWFSGSSRRRSGRRRHPDTTQAPRRHSDASSTGSSASVRLFARPETSPCFPLWSHIHSRIQPPTRPDLLESSTKTAAGTDVRVHRLLRSKSFPLQSVAFIPRCFIPRAGKRSIPRRRLHPKLDTADL